MLIAQISDLHVRPKGVLYQGVADSNRMLSEAIRHLQKLDSRPDLVLLTGDVGDEGHHDEYAMARELLAELLIPYLVIPGNHDHRDNFRAAFSHHAYLAKQGPMHYCIDDYPVRIVALDTAIPGKHHGAVDTGGLNWLQAVLESNRHKNMLHLWNEEQGMVSHVINVGDFMGPYPFA
jgi:Icc protein